MAKNGRYGPYVTEVLPEDAPKSRSRARLAVQVDDLDTITLEEALKLLTLPRVVGVDPESGDEITAQNGRYGPYLKKGTDSRSIDSEEKLLTITLEEALAIYAQPKQRGRAAADPGRELGKDPVSGNTVTVKSGRFGDLRHRRRVQRDAAPGRRRDDDHDRAGGRAARRAARQGPGQEGGQEDREEDRPRRRRRRRPKKTAPRRAPRRTGQEVLASARTT